MEPSLYLCVDWYGCNIVDVTAVCRHILLMQSHPSDAVTSFPFECHVYTVLAQGGVLMSYCSLLHVIPNTLLPFRPEID
jgi:hypothetical protein